MAAGANKCDAVVVLLNEHRPVGDIEQARLHYGTPWADTTLPEAPSGLDQCPIVFVRQIGFPLSAGVPSSVQLGECYAAVIVVVRDACGSLGEIILRRPHSPTNPQSTRRSCVAVSAWVHDAGVMDAVTSSEGRIPLASFEVDDVPASRVL